MGGQLRRRGLQGRRDNAEPGPAVTAIGTERGGAIGPHGAERPRIAARVAAEGTHSADDGVGTIEGGIRKPSTQNSDGRRCRGGCRCRDDCHWGCYAYAGFTRENSVEVDGRCRGGG